MVTLCILVPFNYSFAADFYVAPNGSNTSSGSKESPWSLPFAFSHPAALKPGDTVYVRGGTYHGRFRTKVLGTVQNRITFVNYKKERVVLDGNYNLISLSSLPTTTAGYTNGEIKISDSELLRGVSVIAIDNEDMKILSLNPNGIVKVTRGWSGTCGTGACPSHAAQAKIEFRDPVFETEGGGYGTYIGFEVTQTAGKRILETTGSALKGTSLGSGVNILDPGIKIINFIVHDNASGLSAWSTAPDTELYGNLVFDNGWIAPDRNHGHGIYTQNNTGEKLFERNVVVQSSQNTLQMYGSDQSFLNNFTWKENVFSSGRTIFGGSAPINNLKLIGNFNYTNPIELGYSNPNNTGILITDNYLMGGLTLQLSKNVEVYDNTIYGGPSLRFSGTDNKLLDYKFDRNTYLQKNQNMPYNFAYVPLNPLTASTYTWWNKQSPGIGYGGNNVTWQEDMGYDPNGTYIPGLRSGVKTFLLKNKYNSDLATLVVYNNDKKDSITFNPGDFIAPGDTYSLRSAINYFNDNQEGTYTGGDISVSMINHIVSTPRGINEPFAETTFPGFGIFMVTKSKRVLPAAPSQLRLH